MKKLSYLFSCLLLFSCSAAQPAEQQQLAQLDEQEPRVESEHQAVKLAKRHLALKNRDWGNISKVQEEEGYFRIAFETPTQEQRLIGQRAILVNKDSGLVSVVQRR
jgi:hypothetical protein